MADPAADPNLLFGLPYGVGLDLNAWVCSSVPTQDMDGYLGEFDEQYIY